jgi:N-acetyl-gamma-glutamyl-phosphate reductase
VTVPVFIDGVAGTTGLLIDDILRDHHPELEVLRLPAEHRKDPAAKRAMVAEAECVVLCLPDAAARESVALADEVGVRVLDASSAHRVDDRWAYGLPELDGGAQRDRIRSAWHVANPGCYATGAVLALAPLTRGGLLDPAAHVPIVGVSGYSGGGRAMLSRFGGDGTTGLRFGSYSHGGEHKHVREITRHARLTRKPQFVPSVGNFERGMAVIVQLAREAFTRAVDAATVLKAWSDSYADEQFVRVRLAPPSDEHGLLLVDEVVGTNFADLYCFDSGADDLTLICHLDNLGKGASLAAVQNLNVMFGFGEELGIDHYQRCR